MIVFFVSLLGLAAGSFAGVLSWRLKRGQDYVRGRSACERCGHVLSAPDLIPVLGWLMLGGRCRYCGKPISVRHLIVELSTGLLFGLLAWRLGYGNYLEITSLVFWLLASVLLVALFIYDLEWQTLPNRLMYPLLLLGLAYALTGPVLARDPKSLAYAALGPLAVGGLFYAFYHFSRGKWLGAGDVKLAAFIGLGLGWPGSLLAVMLSSWLGLFGYALLALRDRRALRRPIAFGPFLIAGTYLTLLVGPQLLNAYLGWLSGY
jgi:prepilin signal peptidase PulO-like enzyme (type II secretory pathway)